MATIKVADAKVTARIIKDKIHYLGERIEDYSGSENPQIKEASHNAELEKGILENVLESLQGNHVNLKI